MNDLFSIIAEPVYCGIIQMMIYIPVAAGLLLFVIPEKIATAKGLFALLTTLFTTYLSVIIFNLSLPAEAIRADLDGILSSFCNPELIDDFSYFMSYTADNLSKLISLLIGIFAVLTALFSLRYIKKEKVKDYYSWFLITLGCSFGAVLSDNLLLLLTFWGMLGITLYKLIPGKDEGSSATAKKTLIMIGASDTIMILGVAIIWKVTGSVSMANITLHTDKILYITAFLALLTGCLTKAGGFPFHTWVPDFARDAPASSSAFLPASLDKLLGIYLLARITTEMFILTDAMRLLLLTLGTITIIIAGMMALVQTDYKRLLGYCAVSQAGYIVVGFGLGSVIGMAAALFHMINHATYKSGLFLAAGSVEYRTEKSNMDDLGGLSKAMPVSFIAALILAMSVSGIPPFNGFASKWMIYQGIVDYGAGSGISNTIWMVWLGLAVLGSALTLATFIKFIGGIFLGRRNKELKNVREAPVLMWIPVAILALACIVLGVFATGQIVPGLLMTVTGEFTFPGLWNSSLVSLMVIVSLIAGMLLYLISGTKKFRRADSFIGGEKIQDQTAFPATEFYKTIGEFSLFGWFYKKAGEKLFDIYDLSKNMVLWFSHLLSKGHSGVLTGYVMWIFAGLVIMLLIML